MSGDEHAMESMRSLPVEGLRLRKLVFSGYGKRSGVAIVTEGAPRVWVPLGNAHMQLSLPGELTIESLAEDDRSIEWRVEPRAEQHILLKTAAVDFPGDESDWQEEMDRFAEAGLRWQLSTAIYDLVVRLVAAEP